MKLISVYNVFDGEEFLERSIRSIRDHVDEVYAVCQDKAYNGYKYSGGYDMVKHLSSIGLIDKVFHWEGTKQIEKRQFCLQVAKGNGATHFLGMDCDEIYDSLDFLVAKEKAMKLKGSYCKIKTYFKSEDLTIGLDNYYVPFIHKIDKNSYTGARDYPVLVDPRRAINGGAEEVDIIMHHYSWVRNDISIKHKSHDSVNLIDSSGLMQDYENAKEGYYIEHYKKTLQRCSK